MPASDRKRHKFARLMVWLAAKLEYTSYRLKVRFGEDEHGW